QQPAAITPTETPETANSETAATASATQVPKFVEKVEIPAKATQLDADLEAEIEAALADQGSLALGETAPTVDSGDGPTVVKKDTELSPGAKVKGKVLSIHGDSVIVDLGTRASGIVPARNFEEGKLPEIGAI